jgi:DNA-binding transcriptional ArsR family regulator
VARVGYLRPKRPLEVEFRISMLANLFHALAQVIVAPKFEGFDSWMYTSHTLLPPDLKEDMEVVVTFMQISSTFNAWLMEFSGDDPIRCDFSVFVTKMEALTEDDFHHFLLSGIDAWLQCNTKSPNAAVSLPSLEDPCVLRKLLQDMSVDEEDLDRGVDLILNPVTLKEQFVSGVTRFWEEFYREEYERSLPVMERSVLYHRNRRYKGDLSTVFTSVTGRLLPEGLHVFQDAERVVFIPSCHIGPYVFHYNIAELRSLLVLLYNCRSTGTRRDEQTPLIENLFPPLKALADETRLQILSILSGRELYAQQIVDRMEISQPAVSRHLQLMVASGILNVRKEESMKYYSINRKVLSDLAERLRWFPRDRRKVK